MRQTQSHPNFVTLILQGMAMPLPTDILPWRSGTVKRREQGNNSNICLTETVLGQSWEEKVIENTKWKKIKNSRLTGSLEDLFIPCYLPFFKFQSHPPLLFY